MRGNEFLDKIGLIAPEYIEEAEKKPQKRKAPLKKWGVIAACFCLVTAGVFGAFQTGFLPLGGHANAGGGSESAAGLTYMFYTGPVFPLSLMEPEESLTAKRNVDFDFSPYRTRNGAEKEDDYRRESIITDSYTLTNPAAAQSVTLLYPFAADLREELSQIPQITVNGSVVEPTLHIGPYLSDFQTTGNAQRLNSWEDCKTAVEAGCQNLAFDELPTLSQTVTVYEICDIVGEAGENGLFPQLEWSTELDFDRTCILSYGFNSISYDVENSSFACSFVVPEKKAPEGGGSNYIIVCGDDVESYELLGYTNGANKTRTDSAGATVKRYETTLDAIIRQTAEQYLTKYVNKYDDDRKLLLSGVSLDTFCGLAAESLENSGFLSEPGLWLQYLDSLEMLYSEVLSRGRMVYFAFDITLPAASAVSVEMKFTRPASVDYIGKNRRRDGYDLVTRLGSTLDFSEQTASVSNTDEIEILNQNFGFAPETGVNRVTLDLTKEHYYLEVAKKER